HLRDLPDERIAELDACHAWLGARAADAPGNFRHLVRLIDAERAAALGELGSALVAYAEAAEGATARPWHRAFITERAARCHLAQGLGHSGRLLLREARQAYAAWGAAGKVTQLDRELKLDRELETGFAPQVREK